MGVGHCQWEDQANLRRCEFCHNVRSKGYIFWGKRARPWPAADTLVNVPAVSGTRRARLWFRRPTLRFGICASVALALIFRGGCVNPQEWGSESYQLGKWTWGRKRDMDEPNFVEVILIPCPQINLVVLFPLLMLENPTWPVWERWDVLVHIPQNLWVRASFWLSWRWGSNSNFSLFFG